MNENLEAKRYLKQPVFKKLAKELARRYYLKGDFGTAIGLQILKEIDTEPLRQFLGMTPWYWESQKRLRIIALEEALMSSALKWSLNDFVVYLTNQPLLLKSEVEEREQEAYKHFLLYLTQIDPIFCESLADQQLKQWFQEEGDVFEAFKKVEKAWRHLPTKYTYLPFFAYQQTGDAHAFDETEFAGRLLLQMFAAKSKNTTLDQQLSRVEEKNLLLNEFYLLKDDIHNFIAIRGLVAEKNGEVSQMWHYAWKEKTAWNVPLKEILQVDKIYSPNNQSVLIIENSSVYSVLLELLPEITIICSSGQFSYAVWQLLRKLVASGNKLYYSGDLDPEGLMMAQKLIEMFPEQVETIGMSQESYQRGREVAPLLPNQLQQLNKIEEKNLKKIAEEMKATHKKAYQEGFLDLLLNEVAQKFSN